MSVKDQIAFFSNPPELRQPSFRILSAVQSEKAGIQILAVATALVAMCDGVGEDAHEIISRINRGMQDLDTPFAKEVRAIKEYAKGELNV